jgi:hypothetical protein
LRDLLLLLRRQIEIGNVPFGSRNGFCFVCDELPVPQTVRSIKKKRSPRYTRK